MLLYSMKRSDNFSNANLVRKLLQCYAVFVHSFNVVQECDARNDDICTEAEDKKNKKYFVPGF